MAKEVIILEVNTNTPNQMAVHYLLWLTSTKPVPRPNFNSQWTGASAGETSALQAGTVVEESYSVTFPQSFGTGNIKTFVQDHYNDRQAYFTSQTQPGQYYGVYYDSSTGWSA